MMSTNFFSGCTASEVHIHEEYLDFQFREMGCSMEDRMKRIMEEEKHNDLDLHRVSGEDEDFYDELMWRRAAKAVNKIYGNRGARQYIECSFDEGEQEHVKELGARWDPDQQKWYTIFPEAYAKLARWHPKTPTGPPSVPPAPPPAAGGPMPRKPARRPHEVSPYTRDATGHRHK